MPSDFRSQKQIATSVHHDLRIEFNSENTQIIREMVGKFGNDEEEVVINALTFLYTIYKYCPDADTVVVWKDGVKKHYRIPIEM